jgi:GTPase SAR1 family protein
MAFSLLSSLRANFLGRDECRVIVVGLDGSGKTTIVYRLKHGKIEETHRTRAAACVRARVDARAALEHRRRSLSSTQRPSASTASASSSGLVPGGR